MMALDAQSQKIRFRTGDKLIATLMQQDGRESFVGRLQRIAPPAAKDVTGRVERRLMAILGESTALATNTNGRRPRICVAVAPRIGNRVAGCTLR